jgi:1-acyl-sn-glycerol-3-phosphate acyltransferase
MNPKTARRIVRFIVPLLAKVQVDGLENIPPTGACILVGNHLGRLDAPLGYCYCDRDDLTLMVAEKYQKNPFFRFFVTQFHGIWVDRFNADLVAMRASLNRLKEGAALVIAPEGTRSPTEALNEGKPGASFLALKAGVPLIPVAITGTEDRVVKECYQHLRRPKVKAVIGRSFTLPPMPKGTSRDAAIQAATEEIMCQIASYLPPKYYGIYADLPRLKELTSQRVAEATH